MNNEPSIMNVNTALSQALGLDIPNTNTQPAPPPQKALIPRPIASNSVIQNDATYVRENIYEIIEQGAQAIYITQNLLAESLHPRAAEVLAQLLKVQSDNVDKLIKLHSDMKKLNETANAAVSPLSVNNSNVVFCGTSDELVRMIRNKERDIIDVKVEDNGS